MTNLMTYARVNPLFVRDLIARASEFDWQVQGFGMFRMYLTEAIRLHVWFHDLRRPNVSSIHNHPWDFVSLVIRGSICNSRFGETQSEVNSDPYHRATIRCGTGAQMESRIDMVRLEHYRTEIVRAGETYSQRAEEIHDTKFDNGTVTLIERKVRGDLSADHARVYWPGGQWIDAKPRPATGSEINVLSSRLLNSWYI